MAKFLVCAYVLVSLLSIRAHNPCLGGGGCEGCYHGTPAVIYAHQDSQLLGHSHGYKLNEGEEELNTHTGRESTEENGHANVLVQHQNIPLVPIHSHAHAPVINIARQMENHVDLQQHIIPIQQQQYVQIPKLVLQHPIQEHGAFGHQGLQHQAVQIPQHQHPIQEHGAFGHQALQHQAVHVPQQIIGQHHLLHSIPQQTHFVNVHEHTLGNQNTHHNQNAHLGGASVQAHYGSTLQGSSHAKSTSVFINKSSYQPVNVQGLHLGSNHIDESGSHKSTFINGKYHVIRPDGSVFKHHPSYRFEYSVNDHKSGDIHQQKEEREGDLVQGEYSLVEPDGNVRTVKYTADWKTGFHAQVINSKTKNR